MAFSLPRLTRRKPDPAPLAPPLPGSVSRNALALIAVIMAGAALFWLRDIVTPLALALFLLVMIDGVTRWIADRTPVPPRFVGWVSAILIFLALFGSIWVIVEGLSGIIYQGRGIGVRLDAIIADVAGLFGMQTPPAARDLLSRLDLPSYAARAALTTQSVMGGAFFTLVYLGFLMASKRTAAKKSLALFPDRQERDDAVQVFQRMRGGVEGYLWVQTVTGLMISGAAWILMAALGLDNALFWAFLIFIVGYIPVIGGAIAAMGPPLYALVQYDTYWQPIVIFLGLQVILQVTGNFIQPRMQGDNQNIDPVVVLLSLALWGKLWGVVGMFLSTPLAVMAMAILAEFKGSRWMAVLLSGDGQPYAGEASETPARGRGAVSRKGPAKSAEEGP